MKEEKKEKKSESNKKRESFTGFGITTFTNAMGLSPTLVVTPSEDVNGTGNRSRSNSFTPDNATVEVKSQEHTKVETKSKGTSKSSSDLQSIVKNTRNTRSEIFQLKRKPSDAKVDTEYPKINEEFHQYFDISDEEVLITYYTVSVNGKQGRMYISKNYVCFYGTEFKHEIPFKSVIAIEKNSSKSGYEIITPTDTFTFSPVFGSNPYKGLSKIFQPHESKNRSIFHAVQNQDVELLKALLKNYTRFHVNILEQGEEGELPIHAAIKSRNINIIDIMLKFYKDNTSNNNNNNNNNSLNINQKDSLGWTALHYACSSCVGKNVEDITLKMLLQFPGIQVEVENNDLNTPLHYFAQNFCSPSCQELGELLIKKGSNVNHKNKNGETPLHKAMFNNSVRLLMVELLLSNNADVNIVNSHGGETVLHYAVFLGRSDLLKILLHAGAVSSITVKSKRDNKTPYETAISTNQTKIAEILKKVLDLLEFLKKNDIQDYILYFMKEDLYLEVLSELDKNSISTVLEPIMSKLTTGLRFQLEKAILSLSEEENSFKESLKKAEKRKKKGSSITTPPPSITSIKTNLLIVHKELEYTKKLGSGASGKVYKCIYKQKKVAVKVFKTGDQMNLQEVYEEFQKELDIMSTISSVSPYVVGLYGACLEPKVCLVMEYCSRGSLFNVLNSNSSKLNAEQAFKFIHQIVSGMRTLHTHFDKPILHRDLKSLNILITDDFNCRITDFGLARFETDENRLETLKNPVGTIGWNAPEVLSGIGYTEKSDIWSLGIIFWEIFYRVINGTYQRPYEEFKIPEFLVVAKVIEQTLTPSMEGWDPSISAIIRKCWRIEEERPKIEELQEEWKNLDVTTITLKQ